MGRVYTLEATAYALLALIKSTVSMTLMALTLKCWTKLLQRWVKICRMKHTQKKVFFNKGVWRSHASCQMVQQAAKSGWRFWIDPGNTSSHTTESSQQPWAHVHVPPQATVLVYQALAEFWTTYDGPEYDLNVDILLPGRSKPEMYNFNTESRYTTRTTKVRKWTFVHYLKHVCHLFCWWTSVFYERIRIYAGQEYKPECESDCNRKRRGSSKSK